MSPFRFAHLARGLCVVCALAPLACAKKAEVKPVEAPDPAPAPPPRPKPSGGSTFNPLGPLGLLGSGGPTAAEAEGLKQKYAALLIGTWHADLGDGFAEERTYTADGTYTAKLTGPAPAAESGKYAVIASVGTKGLKVRFGEEPGARAVTLSFAGAELEHPSLRPGVTGTFRKK